MTSKTIIRPIAAFLLLLAVSLPAYGQSCGQLCDKGFWHSNPTAAQVEAQIEAGADLEAKDILGRTPLHFAAIHGTADTIRTLIAAGADIEAKIKDGATPLHFAAIHGTAEGIEALLKAKANPLAKTKNGSSVKDLARTNYELTGTKVYDWLMNLPN